MFDGVPEQGAWSMIPAGGMDWKSRFHEIFDWELRNVLLILDIKRTENAENETEVFIIQTWRDMLLMLACLQQTRLYSNLL